MNKLPLFLLSGCAFNAAQAQRWNIVYIMSDDHSYQAISAYGHQLSKQAPTPNLDRLAQRGMLFQRAYVENSLSTPSRACLMTGMYSHQSGQRTLDCPIDENAPFVSEYLQKAGYQTAMIGKWHMLCEPKGFDTYRVLFGQGDYYGPKFRTKETNGQFVEEEGYATNLITDHAIKFLNQRDKTKPFALFVHHKAPHRNWMPPLDMLDLYEDVEFPLPETFYDDYATRGRAAHEQEMSIEKDMEMCYDLKVTQIKPGMGYTHERNGNGFRHQLSRMKPEEREMWESVYNPRNEAMLAQNLTGDALLKWKYQRYIRDYMRVIHSIDQQVGRLLNYLEANGLMDNTMVVYTSDQGFYMGEHGWFDKRFMYEESFRTPLLVCAPGMKGGEKSNALVQNIDFAPTFLDIADAEKPQQMVGTSLLPIMSNKGKTPKDWRKYLYYHYYDCPAEHNVMRHDGVSDGRYKLLHFYDPKDATRSYDELYDLKKDPNELNNVVADANYAKHLTRLQTQLDTFRKEQRVDEW